MGIPLDLWALTRAVYVPSPHSPRSQWHHLLQQCHLTHNKHCTQRKLWRFVNGINCIDHNDIAIALMR